MVQIINGANEQRLEIGGWSIGAVREKLGDLFNINDEAQTLLNGHLASDRDILGPDDCLEFVHMAGKKGVGRFLTPKQLMQECGLTKGQYEDIVRQGLPMLKLDSTVLHPETAVDEWQRRFADTGDGLLPPSSFRLGCKRYDGLTPNQWKLLQIRERSASR